MVGERYPILPLPHIPEHTEMIEVGPITAQPHNTSKIVHRTTNTEFGLTIR